MFEVPGPGVPGASHEAMAWSTCQRFGRLATDGAETFHWWDKTLVESTSFCVYRYMLCYIRVLVGICSNHVEYYVIICYKYVIICYIML